MTGFIALPALCFLAMFLTARRATRSWRFSFMIAATIWGLFVTATTELLTLFGQVHFLGLASAWSALLLISIVLLLRSRSRFPGALTVPGPPAFSTQDRLSLGIVVAIVSVIGVIAIVAPPNTWDGMSYHMARVAHWIQAQGVGHYPTGFLPQLYQMPWAEFAIMHFQILSGGDMFANGIQWGAMAGSLVGISLLAGLLGANTRAQIFSVVAAATLPMGILQGSSTQNDYVLTFWLIGFATLSLRWLTTPADPSRAGNFLYATGAGASLGLALLTKGSAFIYAAPLAAWIAFLMFKRLKTRALGYGILIAVVALVINLGHFGRNMALFGKPVYVGPGQERVTNEAPTPAALASNIVRNISLQLGTPFGTVNAGIDRAVRRVHGAIGISVDDPRTTTWGKFGIRRMSTYEDDAGNPIHLALIAVSFMVILFSATSRSQRRPLGYLFAVTAAFLLFCLLLKWQPWNSRLLLPFFVLACPLVGLVLERSRRRRLAAVVVLGLCVSALPWLCFNQSRLLLPPSLVSAIRVPEENSYETIWTASRMDQSFANPYMRDLKEPYVEAAAFLRARGFADIGLRLPFNPLEYQLWALLEAGSGRIRLEHVMVSNVSGSLDDDRFVPAAILRVRSAGEAEETEFPFRRGRYSRQWTKGLVDVFVRVDPERTP